jgi:fructose-specific phosphotransferase system IIC component
MATGGSSQTMQVDLVNSSGIQASAFVTGDVWSTDQAEIQASAAAKGFTVNSYVAAPSDAGQGYQTLSSLSAVNAWIANTAQYAGARVRAAMGNPMATATTAAGTDMRWTVVAIAVGLGAAGVLAWALWR